ncbi:hypothetical protein [Natribacillus halophilus]|uniref:Uncharacterized protein n=1 Tax=Natribacillus halophilus TaxID=549003 RepID=A0A1G8PHV3_9BACI|nr:hypothetical protein [Natribacillus halophilus]SDI91835.1 hypothetical protein SAMN04488123_108141 [Natribacillus halophilus]
MEAAGYLYAAGMTNALAEEVPDAYWEEPLITELGTLRELFLHMIRVRNVYKESLETGSVTFPGDKTSDTFNTKGSTKGSTMSRLGKQVFAPLCLGDATGRCEERI